LTGELDEIDKFAALDASDLGQQDVDLNPAFLKSLMEWMNIFFMIV
jgi:hypothetical protein